MEKDKSTILLKGRLNGSQKNRLARLLDMMYTPSELAKEIGFTVRQVYRVYIPAGCPNIKDQNKHIWINGQSFREWVKKVYQKPEIGQNEAFCMSCKKAVKMIEPERNQEGRLFYYVCKCPDCGRILSRIITRGKPLE
jgi:hypothetical protein